jgi:ERCC4-type nuclease
MSKFQKKTKSNDLNLSSLYVICATGEDKVYKYLQDLNQSTHPFKLFQLPLHTGDILIGYRHPQSPSTYEITASQEENLGANNLASYPELREVQPLYLIERKTIQDFCQSYRSQHYQNQKTRMLSFRDQNPLCQCLLVVEGYYQKSPSSFGRNFPKSTCESCFVSIRLRDKFYVKHVPTALGHAEFIEKCLRTIVRHQLIPSYSPSQTTTHLALAQDYQQTVAVKKKTNMTPELCYKVQLTAIPGISMNVADVIQSHHPNLETLLQHLKTEGPLALAQISLGKQKLGPAKSKRIHEYLVAPQTPSSSKMTLILSSK